MTRHWLELVNQWLEVTRPFLLLDSDSTRPSHDSTKFQMTLTRQKWLGHITACSGVNVNFRNDQGFFRENVWNPVWICRDPISLILGARWWFSLILGTRFEILGTRIGSLKHLKTPDDDYFCVFSTVSWWCYLRKLNECFILDTPFVLFWVSLF